MFEKNVRDQKAVILTFTLDENPKGGGFLGCVGSYPKGLMGQTGAIQTRGSCMSRGRGGGSWGSAAHREQRVQTQLLLGNKRYAESQAESQSHQLCRPIVL